MSYLQLQIDSGVDAIQLFDTWIGNLSVRDFRSFALPHLQTIRDRLHGQVPLIYFGTGNSHLLPEVATVGFDVLAMDWRTPLAQTWEALDLKAVQGNLDPIVLCADRDAVADQAGALLDEVEGRPATSSTWVTALFRRHRSTT